jgi:hypothetical protein
MVVCCQGASDSVVPVVAVDEVEEMLVEVVDPLVVPVVPVPLVVPVPAVVLDSPVVLVEIPGCPVVDVLETAASPVATTDVSGRSVTSAPAALTAT